MGTLSGLLENLDPDSGRRGTQFEHVCRWFLTNDPIYRRELRRVWLWDEWQGRWGPDAGIDLVAEEHNGRLWAIQAKVYDPAYSVTKTDVDTFLSESARPEFSFRLLIATTDRIGKTAERTLQAQEKPASRLLLADLRAAQVSWPRFPSDLRAAKPRPKRPRPHQRQAITAVVRGFESADRGQMIMACGTGKTLTALFIARRLAVKRTLVLVPSLSLLTDTVREWTANDEDFEFLPVCSDDTVTGTDAAVSTTADLGFPVTTDPQDIAAFLRRRSGSRRVVFATYQSSPKIAEAYGLGRIPGFDLVIADEAHRCAGRVSTDFATVLDADAITARKRLFMTATPRLFTGRVVREAKEADFEVASMDDVSRFGPVFHRLGFAEAIERELLTDYRVVIVGVDDATYLDWAQRGRFVTVNGTKVTDARTLAGQIGLAKTMRRYDLHKTISFHSRVATARKFASEMPRVIDWMPARQRPKGPLWSRYASGEMSAGARSALLDHLRYLDSDERGLLANARCLGEGIDVPALDGVAFVDPRRSEVDIVQAVGRAIRLAEHKTAGTVVIPVFIETAQDPDIALDDSAFKPVWDVIKALRAHDDELGEQLDELRRELGRGKKHLRIPQKIHVDLPAHVGSEFIDAFDVHLVDQTTASWEFWFGLLQRFVERAGHALVPVKYEDDDGHRLGGWVNVQRTAYQRGRLAADRLAKLEAVPGWVWDVLDNNWEEAFERLCTFIDREGHARVSRDEVESGYKLGLWVSGQRGVYSRGQLAADRVTRLEALPGWFWDPRAADWEEGFEHLKAFVEYNGHARVPQHWVEDGYRLGQWVSNQRATHIRGNLGPDRVGRLKALPGWTWDELAANWEEGFEHLLHFVERTGHARVAGDELENGYRLGQWVSVQRATHGRGTLDPDRGARLEALPGWVWDSLAANWEAAFENLRQFVNREGHARVPQNHPEDGYGQLRVWVTNQRAKYAKGRLTADRIARLESLPDWEWKPKAALWEEGFEHLLRYVEREGNGRVKPRCLESGYRLGQWVAGQRAVYQKGQLAADRVTRLEAVPGWVWEAWAANWEEGFQHLRDFVDREGHALVPGNQVESDYRLGGWVNAQRSLFQKGQLAGDRVARLEAIPGWVWDAMEANWEEGFQHLLRFVDREGHARVLQKFEDDGYPLGRWVAYKRISHRSGKLGTDRVAKLEALPGWAWDARATE